MKKITFIYDFLKEIGGLERMMFFHANALKDQAKTELLFNHISNYDKNRILHELELSEDIKIKQISLLDNNIIQHALSLLFPSRIKKINTDLIISYSFMAARMAKKKKERDGTPYIALVCHPPNFLYSKVKGWANNTPRIFAKFLGVFFRNKLKNLDVKAIRGANLVVAISKYTAKKIKKIYKVEPVVVYPPISGFFKLISNKQKSDFLKSKGIKKKFLYAHGRIIPDKNFEFILSILDKINSDLIISGDISKEYLKKLNTIIKKLKLDNKVCILGRISKEDLLGYYNCAELFLMPAHREDFGLTIVEAIACGCPVIAWGDDAGPSEIIGNENGLLAKPYSATDFVSKINEGFNIQWDRKKISRTISEFSEKKVAENLTSLVKRYLGD